jgi:hypothetical protein
MKGAFRDLSDSSLRLRLLGQGETEIAETDVEGIERPEAPL